MKNKYDYFLMLYGALIIISALIGFYFAITPAALKESRGGFATSSNATYSDDDKDKIEIKDAELAIDTLMRKEFKAFLELYVTDPYNLKVNVVYRKSETEYLADYNVGDRRYLCYAELSNTKDKYAIASLDNTDILKKFKGLDALTNYTNFKVDKYGLEKLDLDELQTCKESIGTSYVKLDGYKVTFTYKEK